MRILKTLGVLAEGLAWRVTGNDAIGWRIVESLASNDEDVRAIAGITLARRGRGAVPLLERALHREVALLAVLPLLGDIADASAEGELRKFTHAPDARIARAADDALRVLRARCSPPGVARG